jgi:hypothetical protein
MKLCKGCRWVRRGEDGTLCVHPEARQDTVDFVHGVVWYTEASLMRKTPVCGPQGRLFEPKRISWWLRILRAEW